MYWSNSLWLVRTALHSWQKSSQSRQCCFVSLSLQGEALYNKSWGLIVQGSVCFGICPTAVMSVKTNDPVSLAGIHASFKNYFLIECFSVASCWSHLPPCLWADFFPLHGVFLSVTLVHSNHCLITVPKAFMFLFFYQSGLSAPRFAFYGEPSEVMLQYFSILWSYLTHLWLLSESVIDLFSILSSS